jgi:urea transport system substrate-binding protein
VGEEELRGTLAAGRPHLAAWNYFMSIKSPANTEFINKWSALPRPRSFRR